MWKCNFLQGMRRMSPRDWSRSFSQLHGCCLASRMFSLPCLQSTDIWLWGNFFINLLSNCFNILTLKHYLQFSMSGNHPYHKTCYKEQFHPKCDVCKQFVRITSLLWSYLFTFKVCLVLGLLPLGVEFAPPRGSVAEDGNGGDRWRSNLRLWYHVRMREEEDG